MHPSMDQLRLLPIAEKLRVVEELWDDIEATGGRFPFPAWHRSIAESRAAELDANHARAITRDELWRSVGLR